MPISPRQAAEPGTKEEPEPDAEVEAEPEITIEHLIEEMIQAKISDLQAEIAGLERQLEQVDNFTRISLNERKIKQTEANLAEFSDSLTGFAEKAFNDINELEDRLDIQALLLASILESLSDEGVDVDLAEIERYRKKNVVTDATPEERLQAAIDRF